MVNWLWIGKCHLGLGSKQEAKQWLEKTVSYETNLEEELEVWILILLCSSCVLWYIHCMFCCI